MKHADVNVEHICHMHDVSTLTYTLIWLSIYTTFLQAGMTPLHFAAQSGHEGLVRILLNCSGVQTDSASSVSVCVLYIQNVIHNGFIRSSYGLNINSFRAGRQFF